MIDIALQIQRRTKIQQENPGSSVTPLEQSSTNLEGLKDAIQRNHFLVYLPAKPWTNVTKIRNWSHILRRSTSLGIIRFSRYLTPTVSVVHWDCVFLTRSVFLEEARAKKPDSKICYHFLLMLSLPWAAYAEN